MGDSDSALSQENFDIAVTQIESVVQPDSIGNDIWRESFICIHRLILPIMAT